MEPKPVYMSSIFQNIFQVNLLGEVILSSYWLIVCFQA